MSTDQLIFRARLAALEEAASHVEAVAGTQPCGCIYKSQSGMHNYKCVCDTPQNIVDTQNWCDFMNCADTIRGFINR